MKLLIKRICFLMCVLSFSILLFSCSGSNDDNNKKDDDNSAKLTSSYTDINKVLVGKWKETKIWMNDYKMLSDFPTGPTYEFKSDGTYQVYNCNGSKNYEYGTYIFSLDNSIDVSKAMAGYNNNYYYPYYGGACALKKSYTSISDTKYDTTYLLYLDNGQLYVYGWHSSNFGTLLFVWEKVS